ncbi:MAG: hypothetical protein KJP18_00435, partial [Gemmatimonadetes bacterium]|nr:hypothetical protein [Gemmatimonadota bacterium]
STSAVGHQDPRSQGFVAPPAVWDASPDTPPDEWNPGDRALPRTGYAPAYAPTFLDLDVDVMRIHRGDSTVFVVPVPGVPEDTTFHADHEHPPAPAPVAPWEQSPVHGLFAYALSGPGELYAVRRDGERGGLALTVPSGTDYVVSVETWRPDSARAGRIRQGLSAPFVPRDVPAVSDLLLAPAEGPLPERLDDLIDALHARSVFAPGDTVRVAWEVHGLGWRPEQLGYRVEVRENAGGFFSRLGRSLGVVGDRRGQDLDWTEAGPETPGPLFRAVDVVIPRDFEDGRFTLRLEVSSVGRSALVTEREIEVRGRAQRR